MKQELSECLQRISEHIDAKFGPIQLAAIYRIERDDFDVAMWCNGVRVVFRYTGKMWINSEEGRDDLVRLFLEEWNRSGKHGTLAKFDTNQSGPITIVEMVK